MKSINLGDLAFKLLNALPQEKSLENCHPDLRAKRELYNNLLQEFKLIIRKVLLEYND